VAYPELPDPFDPKPDEWEASLREALTGDQVVLCHSLACLLWLRASAKGFAQAERVLLVAPPYREDLEPVARFLDHGAPPGTVENALIVCSDDDPYCPPGAVKTYAGPLEIPYELIPGAGHINTDAGFGEWPWAEAWALGNGD
jgi:predicted alpha/beta hydrolase family esterase